MNTEDCVTMNINDRQAAFAPRLPVVNPADGLASAMQRFMCALRMTIEPTSGENAQKPDGRRRRSAARLAAVQALYQRSIGDVPTAKLLAEFHNHRLGGEVEPDGERLTEADRPFFDDLVTGVLGRQAEIDSAIAERLANGWTLERVDRLMLQILRCGAYELMARTDVPAGAVVSEYVDVADAFYPRAEVGFVNALLDRMAKSVRSGGA